MNTLLFHATTEILELNKSKTAHARNVAKNQARIDKEFDILCPSDDISRSKAVFASDNLEFCAAILFDKTKNVNTSINVYRVQMINPSRHPMCLVSHALKFLNDKNTLIKIISEYWKPTHPWKCWEYLAASMTPLKTEPTPSRRACYGAKKLYSDDASCALKLWPINNSYIVRQI